MSPTTPFEVKPPARARRLLFFLTAVIAILVVSINYSALRHLRCVPMPEATLSMLVKGVAPTPFQYRALVPWILGLFAPGAEVGELGSLSFISELVFHAAFLITLMVWLRKMGLGRSAAVACALWASPLVLVLFVLSPRPIFVVPDTPALFFATLGFWALSQRRFGVFYPVFIVGTLNRETTFLLVVASALALYRELPRRAWAAHLAVQGALWLAIKGMLFALYRGNPGAGLLELAHASGNRASHLMSNLRCLSDPLGLVSIGAVLSCLWLPYLWTGRSLADPVLRQGRWLFLLQAALVLLVGNAYEFRLFGELVGLIVIATIALVRESSSQARSMGA